MTETIPATGEKTNPSLHLEVEVGDVNRTIYDGYSMSFDDISVITKDTLSNTGDTPLMVKMCYWFNGDESSAEICGFEAGTLQPSKSDEYNSWYTLYYSKADEYDGAYFIT